MKGDFGPVEKLTTRFSSTKRDFSSLEPFALARPAAQDPECLRIQYASGVPNTQQPLIAPSAIAYGSPGTVATTKVSKALSLSLFK